MARDDKKKEHKLAKSILNTVLSVPGVARMSTDSIAENLNKVVLRKPDIEGVYIYWEDDDRLNVDLDIISVYGANIPQISYDVQSKVKEMLEQKYGEKVRAINIFVEGVER